MDIKGKKVTILGLGRSGVALAHAVRKLGAQARVSDAGPHAKVVSDMSASGLDGQVEYESGGHTPAFIAQSDLVVVSPGVRRDAPPILWAREKSIPVLGEIEFAWALCPCPVVAVTGSNGKTTVSTLIHQIFQKAGRRSSLCGNIGTPFSGQVLDLTRDHVVVLEISSFQLETTAHFRPRVAVLLNCTQNHMDRHKDMAEYFQAKKRIFANQTAEDFAILNFEDEKIRALSKILNAQVRFFNDSQVRRAHPKDNENFLAARCAAKAYGIGDDIATAVFAAFKGVEHRLEFVRQLNGVDYINDSKATTTESGRWALSRMERPVVMICGGSSKNLDYAPLRSLVKDKVKTLIAIGQIKQQLIDTFGDVVLVEAAETFESAVRQAQKRATPGDCVLLSPMTASFDMFKNFEERGKVFKDIVHRLT